MAVLQLEDFALESAAFEVRYENALMLWDRAGTTWTEVEQALPGLKLIGAEPAKTAFQLDRRFQMTVALEMANVIAVKPSKQDLEEQLPKIADEVIDSMVRNLRIRAFTRVGFRLTFHREYKSQALATTAVLGVGLLNVPSDETGIKAAALIRPRATFRWDNESEGCMVQVYAEKRKVEVQPAFGVPDYEPYVKETEIAVVDLDGYVTGIIPAHALKPSEWISQTSRRLRRQGNAVLSASGGAVGNK